MRAADATRAAAWVVSKRLAPLKKKRGRGGKEGGERTAELRRAVQNRLDIQC